MSGQNKGIIRKIAPLVPILLLLPVIIVFDSLVYFITRPACLNCGSLVDFLRGASLTTALLGGVGYKLSRKEHGRGGKSRTNSSSKRG